MPPPCPAPASAAVTEPRVVAADPHFVVVDKPAGLLSVPGRGEAGRDHLAGRVAAWFADALVVHRLDQATSGLVVFGRGAQAQRVLSIAFAERRVDKRYEAWVRGRVAGDSGRIALPLRVDWPNRPRQIVCLRDGKPALTGWRVLARDAAAGRTRLALEPFTGRSHQLRLHCAAIGHPIEGDALYGPEAAADAAAAPRLMLHATRLAFAHPSSGAPLVFESAVPF